MVENVIQIKGVSKGYGKVQVLSDINLTLSRGKIVGLCGPNGAGKTTLIKILVGLLRDYSGNILIADQKIGPHSKGIISYLPDVDTFDSKITGKRVLSLYTDMYKDFDAQRFIELMERLQLTMDMELRKMSKGMREKFQLALCLARRSEVYILDEPIAGVDPAARDSIIQTVLSNYSEDSLLIISTHLIQDIENVLDEVIFLKDGTVFLHENCDDLRLEKGMSVDALFREVFKW
ncbi:hypothetical protein AOC36_00755 [Erysipelothrix larvae]|uniref:ABC transporter domain-containing protein n=1 Tax=Erysipelothrix larvae TaxID=1514105 RepID=A0A0X8GY55_9FIRM|nr:ABC transporter ATP-binding protein [Erysipelothrix larvae]AMC92573.1 hypothetical protein AOC36_00755 [Erysipelothrix larvae]